MGSRLVLVLKTPDGSQAALPTVRPTTEPTSVPVSRPGLPPYHHLPDVQVRTHLRLQGAQALAHLSAHWDRLSHLLGSGQGGSARHTTCPGSEHGLHPETRAHTISLPATGVPPHPAPLQEALPRYCLLWSHDSSESKLSKLTKQSF